MAGYCDVCGVGVVEDDEYGGYVHLDSDGDLDRTDRGHYAEPRYEPIGEGEGNA